MPWPKPQAKPAADSTGKPSGSPAQAVRCAGHRLPLPPFPLTQRCPPARAHPFSGKHGLRRRGSLFPCVSKWISRTLLKNVQRQLKKVPDYDIVLPHNPLQHEVLEAMKRFFQNRQYDVLVSLRQLLLTAAVLCLFCIPCFAGEWSVSLGMNGGDADTITGDLSLRYTLNPFYGNDMLEIRPLIECAGVYWKRDHDAIWGGGIAGGAVVDFWREGSWRPYVSGSFGGFMLSDNKIASHSLGCNFQFRTKGSAGIRFGESYRHDVQVDVAHFSNAGLNNHNSGFNTYGVSYGFRF